MKASLLTISTLLILGTLVKSQQIPDTIFTPKIEFKTFEDDLGPVICIDSAHNNLHTLAGGFAPFARLMKADGFRVRNISISVNDTDILSDCDIYAIINPLHSSNIGNWQLPNPSAFTEVEINEIGSWVKEGGRLFLVADHMPFGGAAFELAQSFGFVLSNGFARLDKEENEPDYFSRQNKRLQEHSILEDGIESVTTFTGSAFTYPEEAEVILKFKEGDVSLEPEIAWQFSDTTESVSLVNYAQGAVLNYGGGKVALFGEAAMFTAQIITTQNGVFKVGFNSRIAPNNQLFAVKLMEYLIE